MELIDTIYANWLRFDQGPAVDWSLDGGPIWLLGATVGTLLLLALWGHQAAQEDRWRARQLLYRRAEALGQGRVDARDYIGHFEIIRW